MKVKLIDSSLCRYCFTLSFIFLAALEGCSSASAKIQKQVSLTSASNARQTGESSSWVSPDLGLNRKTVEQSLGEPFDYPYHVTLKSAGHPAKTVASCLDYLPVENSIYSAGPAVDFEGLRSDGARCDALNLLLSWKSSRTLDSSPFSFKSMTTADLPPTLALTLSDEEHLKEIEIQKQGGNLLDVDKSVSFSVQTPHKAQLSGKGWKAKLELYGYRKSSDEEEIVIRRDAEVIGGTYRSTVVYLLSRPAGKSRFQVLSQRP